MVFLPALFRGDERGLTGRIDEVAERGCVRCSVLVRPCQTHDGVVLDVEGGHSRLLDHDGAAGLGVPEQQLVERRAFDLPHPRRGVGQERNLLLPVDLPIIQVVRPGAFPPDIRAPILLQKTAIHFRDQPQLGEKAAGANQQRLADMEAREPLLFQQEHPMSI
jgi:hypothetical protein